MLVQLTQICEPRLTQFTRERGLASLVRDMEVQVQKLFRIKRYVTLLTRVLFVVGQDVHLQRGFVGELLVAYFAREYRGRRRRLHVMTFRVPLQRRQSVELLSAHLTAAILLVRVTFHVQRQAAVAVEFPTAQLTFAALLDAVGGHVVLPQSSFVGILVRAVVARVRKQIWRFRRRVEGRRSINFGLGGRRGVVVV